MSINNLRLSLSTTDVSANHIFGDTDEWNSLNPELTVGDIDQAGEFYDTYISFGGVSLNFYFDVRVHSAILTLLIADNVNNSLADQDLEVYLVNDFVHNCTTDMGDTAAVGGLNAVTLYIPESYEGGVTTVTCDVTNLLNWFLENQSSGARFNLRITSPLAPIDQIIYFNDSDNKAYIQITSWPEIQPPLGRKKVLRKRK